MARCVQDSRRCNPPLVTRMADDSRGPSADSFNQQRKSRTLRCATVIQFQKNYLARPAFQHLDGLTQLVINAVLRLGLRFGGGGSILPVVLRDGVVDFVS